MNLRANSPAIFTPTRVAQVDDDNGSLFNHSQREALKSLLTERDEMITLLARSDPSATDRLFAVYSTYNKVANKRG